jgi:prepilin-type N-terminal cleavage/methylation domain-containing protein
MNPVSPNYHSPHTCTRRPAFTLLEVSLVVGVLSVLLGMALVTSFSAISTTSLRSADTILVQALRRAQTLSQQSTKESSGGTGQWGVYICEGTPPPAECTTATHAAIILFEGGSPSANGFTSRVSANDQIFEINPTITFTGALYHKMRATSGGLKKGLTFTQFKGDPVESRFSGAIILQIGPNSRIITVNGKGVVER